MNYNNKDQKQQGQRPTTPTANTQRPTTAPTAGGKQQSWKQDNLPQGNKGFGSGDIKNPHNKQK